jgi:hypothetical protein
MHFVQFHRGDAAAVVAIRVVAICWRCRRFVIARSQTASARHDWRGTFCSRIAEPFARHAAKEGTVEKDRSILALADELRRAYGDEMIRAADHWDADLYAVGFERSDASGRLVYVSTFGQPEGKYACVCESLDERGLPHDVLTERGVDRDRLLELTEEHLRLPNRRHQ